MINMWKWAIVTPEGIYQGTLTGQIEPGETQQHATQMVSGIVQDYLKTSQNVPTILACMVSDSELYIDAPETELIELDIEQEFSR